MTLQISDDFDLERIAQSGQCFRWEKIDDKTYRITALDECLYVEKIGKTEFAFDCDEETFQAKWHSYFDLDEDYRKIRRRIDRENDPFLHTAAGKERGIRILRQDPWEMLISFIISQNRNIPAIQKSIELLSEACGQKKKDSRGEYYHCFPTAKALSRLSDQSLEKCRLGYRAKYVTAAAKAVCEGAIDFHELTAMSSEDAITELTKLYGVGVKVANCVALFGLHQLNAFPIDVWVKRILENEYKEGYPFEKYAPYNGVYQQYMFAYYRKVVMD